MAVTKSELKGGLRGLDLTDGDRVILHSSLSSIGYVEGGGDSVVDAFLEVIGPEGTLMVPTFTQPTEESPFEQDLTPSETGAITEAVRQRAEAKRSGHPTHSVTTIGSETRSLTMDHSPMNSLGVGSPMHRLIQRGGNIVLLGVTHTANSSVHIAEALADVPYRDQKRDSKIIKNGEATTVTTNAVHCSLGFDKLQPLVQVAGCGREGYLGEARTRVYHGPMFLELVREALEEQPGLILCDDPSCERCEYARREICDE